MLKKLNISNFQSHEYSELKFSEGCNIIVGNSDSGKTAIIRALRWLVWNKPSGDAMRSYWGGKTKVELFTDDAHIIKSKDKEQEYILGDTHFKAFGTNVPEEIAKALNLSSINLQNQLDSPFLLSKTPGEVVTHFNSIAGLSKIDTSLQNINSWLRQLTSDIKYDEGQEKTLTDNLSKFDHLEKFEAEVEILEEMDKQYTSVLQKQTKLETLILNIKNAENDIEENSEILQFEEQINLIFKWKDSVEDVLTEGSDLRSTIKQIEDAQKELIEQEAILAIEKPLNIVLNLYNELETLDKEQISLSKTLSNINSVQSKLNDSKENYALAKAEFEEAIPIGSVCPLCNQIIKRK